MCDSISGVYKYGFGSRILGPGISVTAVWAGGLCFLLGVNPFVHHGSNGEIQVRGKYLERKFSQVRKFDKENIRRVEKFREWKY
jgi:hypothetical protein